MAIFHEFRQNCQELHKCFRALRFKHLILHQTGTDQRVRALARGVMDQHTHLLAHLALNQLP